MVAWVRPGVTWSVAWCYLALPEVLPGVTWALPGLSFWDAFLWSQNTRVPQTQTFEKIIFHKPGNVTWSRACPCYRVALN